MYFSSDSRAKWEIWSNKKSSASMIKRLMISMMLLTGTAHTADEDIDIVRSAAEQGDAEAQFNLGYMYDKGTGVFG